MTTWLLILAIVMVIFLVALLWWRHQTTKSVLSTSVKPPSKHFHGVSIRPGSGACRAVLAIATKRYLPNEAPKLPMNNCDVSYCACRYEHYQDRRDELDRRHDHIDMETQKSGKEHREKKDRRHGRR